MQLRKILVGVKPGSSDRSPVRAAVRLAAAANARLLVLSVIDSVGRLSEPEAEVRRVASEFDGLLDPGQATYQVAVGLPAVEIARWSDSGCADLIVVGCEPGPRPARPAGDCVVAGAVRRARVPCLVVRSGEPAFRRILAAIDGSPDSADVLSAAAGFTGLMQSGLVALQVEPPPQAGGKPSWTREPRSLSPLTAHRFSDGRGAAAVLATPACCEIVVRHGDPVAQILRAVREEGIDLLVHGHHRGGPRNGHETGSIAARLLERAPCAVLTVPI